MKLVRDNYDPDREKSRLAESEDEFRVFLRAKLVEEATEVMVSMNEENLIEEVGDVLDVLDAIISHYGITSNKLEKSRRAKRKIKGGFTKGVIKLK